MDERSPERQVELDDQDALALVTCPQCGHDTVGSPSWESRLWGTLRRRPARAECPTYLNSAESGNGMPGSCFCRDPWHS